MSNANLESKISPKCFWEWKWETGTMLKNITGRLTLVIFLLNITSCAWFEGSGLKLIFHSMGNLLISFKSLLRLLVVVSDFLTLEKKDMSSANNLEFHWRLLDEALMKISRGVLKQSERPWTLWVPKLGSGKKINIQCFLLFAIILWSLKLFFHGW